MSELLKMIVYMLAGSGVVAWVVTIWAVVLTLQKRLIITVLPKKPKKRRNG